MFIARNLCKQSLLFNKSFILQWFFIFLYSFRTYEYTHTHTSTLLSLIHFISISFVSFVSFLLLWHCNCGCQCVHEENVANFIFGIFHRFFIATLNLWPSIRVLPFNVLCFPSNCSLLYYALSIEMCVCLRCTADLQFLWRFIHFHLPSIFFLLH